MTTIYVGRTVQGLLQIQKRGIGQIRSRSQITRPSQTRASILRWQGRGLGHGKAKHISRLDLIWGCQL